MRQLEGLSLVVGLAVMQALRELGIPAAGLKWPNDVLVGQKKIAGILLELVGDPADVCHVVLGVGINVNMQMTDEVDQQWTSMRLESGKVFDRNHLVAALGGDAPGVSGSSSGRRIFSYPGGVGAKSSVAGAGGVVDCWC